MERSIDFYTGCYSEPLGDMEGNGKGICRVTLYTLTGQLTDQLCVAPCVNPSYLTWSPDRKTVYATREVVRPDTPALTSFNHCASDQWQVLSTVELDGECPCHVAVDPTGSLLASSQYVSGDIAVYELGSDGKIGPLQQLIQHSGHGLNETRQEGPHAHFAAFHNDNLLTADLGIDAVLAYPVSHTHASVNKNPTARAQAGAGSGPRHMAIIENRSRGYVLCELSEELCHLSVESGSLIITDTLPAFVNRHYETGSAAAIKISPDQRHLYASGRNQSVIACFEIEASTGKLTTIGEFSTEGTGPRDFALSPDGAFLIAANQITNNLVSFRRDSESGRLEATGYSIESGSPVCVLF